MSPLGWFHFVAALAALGSGAAVFLRRKGTRPHRRLGWVYVGAMLALNVSALFLYRLTGHFGPFHVAAIVSLATLAAGVLTIRRRRAGGSAVWIERHYYWMAYSYVGLAAAAVAESASRFAPGVFWQAVLAATAVVLLTGAITVTRRASPTLAPFRRGSF